MNKIKREESMAFALIPTVDGKPPILSIGIPAIAWDRIKGGIADTIDLTSIGFPVRIMLWGAPTHDAAVAKIFEAGKAAGVPVLDERRHDFSIKTDKA